MTETRYARSGELSIAWQHLGDGPIDLLVVPGLASHVEAFHELPGWHEPDRLFASARVAVVPREGYAAPDSAWLSNAFPGREDRVMYVEAPHLGVSSTGIRARIGAGRTIRYLVPVAVASYIDDRGLYRSR